MFPRLITIPDWENIARGFTIFNVYCLYSHEIDDHGYDGNHINGIISLTDKGISVRQSFL